MAGSDLPILVIGGGIGGLSAAIALGQRGFAVDLIERDPDWSVYGVGIIQQANVVRAVADLGILDDYLDSGFGFDHVRMFAPDGTPVATIPSPRLADAAYPANIGIGRPALQRVLVDRARQFGTKIRLGITVTDLTEQDDAVTVGFSDGTTARYSVVVGADGLYSETRARILPDAATPELTGQAVWRYNFPLTDDVDGLFVHAGRIGIGLVPLSKTHMYMFVTTPEPGNPRYPTQGLAARMRDRLAEAPPRIAALRDQIVDDAAVVYRPLETLFVEGPWHRGRIVLIGDAVHASTPHLGQGGGMAIEDALVLADELAETPADPRHAFERFAARRQERCRFIVEGSKSVGEFQLGRIPALDYPGLTREMFRVTAAPL